MLNKLILIFVKTATRLESSKNVPELFWERQQDFESKKYERNLDRFVIGIIVNFSALYEKKILNAGF